MNPILFSHRWWGVALLAAATPTAWPIDLVTLRDAQQTRTIAGEVLVTAEDGGLLVMDRDGVLWTVPAESLVERAATDVPFQPSEPKEYAQRLLTELPPGFRTRQTAHYLFLYNTSTAYAKWCGVLYERLYRAFYNFWRRHDVTLQEARFPLVAIVFSDRPSFQDYGRNELGAAVESVVGYYSMRTNRVVMYDLTGIEQQRPSLPRRHGSVSVQQLLAQPGAVSNVATIVHEATHQLAFNSGLQTRYADNPLWLSEGLAMFFETPDFGNEQGWKRVGGIHPIRLRDFQRSLPQRTSHSLAELVSQDDRLRDPETAGQAYAEAWALSYYLLKKHPDRFASYVTSLAASPPLQMATPQQRWEQLETHLGDLSQLDHDFLEYMATLR